MTTFVLVHAPLAAPATWEGAASELSRRRMNVATPGAISWASLRPPFWQTFSEVVASRVAPSIDSTSPVVLVGHSGAGFMLPLIARALPQPVAAYVFVDAVVPENDMDPNADGYFDEVSVGGFIPPFTDAVLRASGIENNDVRARLAAELRPLPLAVYHERVPVPPGWPDGPCAFLRFNRTFAGAYEPYAARAKREKWPYRELDGGHFHMLVDPDAVASAIVALTQECGVTNH